MTGRGIFTGSLETAKFSDPRSGPVDRATALANARALRRLSDQIAEEQSGNRTRIEPGEAKQMSDTNDCEAVDLLNVLKRSPQEVDGVHWRNCAVEICRKHGADEHCVEELIDVMR